MVGLLMALFAITVHAQVDTGTILGSVTDTTQAVFAGVSVTLINQQTAARQFSKRAQMAGSPLRP